MKITMLRNPAARFGCELQEGQTGKVDADLGRRLVAMGIAVELQPSIVETVEPEVKEKPTQKIRGVSKSPEVSKPTEPAVSKSKDNASK